MTPRHRHITAAQTSLKLMTSIHLLPLAIIARNPWIGQLACQGAMEVSIAMSAELTTFRIENSLTTAAVVSGTIAISAIIKSRRAGLISKFKIALNLKMSRPTIFWTKCRRNSLRNFRLNKMISSTILILCSISKTLTNCTEETSQTWLVLISQFLGSN